MEEYISRFVTTSAFLVITLFADLCNAGKYCVYLHEDYYTLNQKYCEAGCCNDYGDDDEICCFSWTVGVIIGICFACVGFIAIVVFLIICCYTMKKRSRAGQIINPAPATQNNMVVYTASAGYSYPHPQTAFYPASRFPGQPMAPPPYTAGTQPAYPPTSYPDQSQNVAPPPPLAGMYGTAGQANVAHGSNAQMLSQNPDQQYGGYGKGQF